jgi:hypothetical protein
LDLLSIQDDAFQYRDRCVDRSQVGCELVDSALE